MLNDYLERPNAVPCALVECRVPLGRLGTAADVPRLALFPASDDSEYVTGASYATDGAVTVG